MNEIQIKNQHALKQISNINVGIMKSFDNLMFQQNKMDNKAFIFIGFMSVILGVINKPHIINNPINWIFGLAICLLACSMLPQANKINTQILNFMLHKEQENRVDIKLKHNIFYYLDLYSIDMELFTTIMREQYKLSYLSPLELGLMEQIIINAKILKLKIFWHNVAYWVLFGGLFIWGFILIIKNIFPIY